MKKADHEKDTPAYLNLLFLATLLEICKNADVPDAVLKNIESVLDVHAYDVSPRLRRESRIVSEDFAAKILESFVEEHEPEYGWYAGDRWDDALVSVKQAAANKVLWKEAMESGQDLEIRYISDTSGYAVRTVKPTGIRGPYGEGYCYLRMDDRVFRFDRMLEVRVKDE